MYTRKLFLQETLQLHNPIGKGATILTAAQQKIIECNDKYENLPKRESAISNYTSIIAKLIDIYILL